MKASISTRIFGKFLQLTNPGFSYCKRCGFPWNFAAHFRGGHHSVNYERSYGIIWYGSHFALCEKCWTKTTIEEKIHYYTQAAHINKKKT